MAKYSVFIDGQEGTTGLRIRQMLAARQDIEVLLIDAAQRKDARRRAEFIQRADLAVLCLPDEAAAEAIELAAGASTRLLDTSTPRRVQEDWVYGLPEIGPEQRQAIAQGRQVANCGCYPVSYILGVRPLVRAGLLDAAAELTVNAVSGYSGGGRRMIEAYRQAGGKEDGDAAWPFMLYGLDGGHKHLAEMGKFSLLQRPPLFVPSVVQTYCGMLVSIPLPPGVFARPGVGPEAVWDVWQAAYGAEPFVHLMAPENAVGQLRDGKFLDIEGCAETNRVELFVFGTADQGLVLVGRLDNLGKGAAGNAVQCLNLMLGAEETAGLVG